MYKNISFHKFFAKKDYLLIIFLHLQDLDTKYLNVIRNDLDAAMPYKKGSTQYVSETLKRADNIKLYQ